MFGVISTACGSCATRSARRWLALALWLGSTTLAFDAQSQALEPARTPPSRISPATQPASTPDELQLPLSMHAYTRQVQLGTLDWVFHPGIALGVEFPRWRVARFSFFPVWRAGFEHHAHLQQRWYVGVAPSVRFDVHPRLAAQLSLGVSGALLRSLWTPYRFNDGKGTWSRGESEDKWSWLFDVEATVWFNASERLGIGLSYGVGALYPFAEANDAPLLPLTRLGLCGRWVVGV